MRCNIFLIAVFLLIIPFTYATEIHNAWHYYRESFKIDTDLYTVTLNSDNNLIRLQKNNEVFLIRLRDCAETTFFKYCFKNASFDSDKVDIDPSGKTRPGIQLIFYSIQPTITISKTASKTNPSLNEPFTITVTISNTGNMDTNYYYEETIPSDLQIITTENSTKTGRTIASSGSIGPGRSKVFEYTLKPTVYGSWTLSKNNLTYEYEGVTKSMVANALTIQTLVPYTITESLSSGSVNIDTASIYTLTIANNDPYQSIIPNIIINTPELDAYDFSRDFKKINYQTFSYSEPIAVNETATFYIKVRSPYTGHYNVSSKIYLFINNVNFSSIKGNPLIVQTPTLSPSIIVDKTSMRPSEPFTVKVFFKNNDLTNLYYNINATLKSGFFNENIFVNNIAVNDEINPFTKTYYSPIVDDNTDLKITLDGTYNTVNNEQFNFSTQKIIQIVPTNKSFDITQDIDNINVYRGDNITVSIKIKNLQDDAVFGVNVNDDLPPGLIKIQGEPRATIDLIGQELKEAYIYKFMIPKDYALNTFNITTILNYNKNGVYTKSKSTTITVKETPGQIPQNQTNQTQQQQQPQKETKKASKGFFSDIIDEISNFFARLFGKK